MTEINYGLSIGDNAPLFEILDIDKQEIKLKDLLNSYRGVLIDFFRGNW